MSMHGALELSNKDLYSRQWGLSNMKLMAKDALNFEN